MEVNSPPLSLVGGFFGLNKSRGLVGDDVGRSCCYVQGHLYPIVLFKMIRMTLFLDYLPQWFLIFFGRLPFLNFLKSEIILKLKGCFSMLLNKVQIKLPSQNLQFTLRG